MKHRQPHLIALAGRAGRAQPERGAALLLALLIVALVAVLAAQSLWQQWRNLEIEAAERARAQMQWLLTGALDFSRLVLREDAKQSKTDHLAEPWAVPLQESKLSTFLSQDKQWREGDPEVYLSGVIEDEQGKLNWTNLRSKANSEELLTWQRLLTLLDIPAEDQIRLLDSASNDAPVGSDTSSPPTTSPSSTNAARSEFLPDRLSDLTWLGVSTASAVRLKPWVTVLPAATPINLNTASPEVLFAALPQLDWSRIQRFVQERNAQPLDSLDQAQSRLGLRQTLSATRFAVGSSYFTVWGRIRMDRLQIDERSLILRSANQLPQVIWRARNPGEVPTSLQVSSAQPSP